MYSTDLRAHTHTRMHARTHTHDNSKATDMTHLSNPTWESSYSAVPFIHRPRDTLGKTFLGQHPHSKCNFILSNTQRCFYLQEVKHTMHKAQGHVIHTGSQVPYLDILKLIMEIRNFWQSKYIVKCVESHFGLVLCKPEELFILGYTNKSQYRSNYFTFTV